MKKNLTVVLINVEDFSNGRKIAENIENQEFTDAKTVIAEIQKQGQKRGKSKHGLVLTYPMTDFMDACNNQEAELGSSWVSYVYLKK